MFNVNYFLCGRLKSIFLCFAGSPQVMLIRRLWPPLCWPHFPHPLWCFTLPQHPQVTSLSYYQLQHWMFMDPDTYWVVCDQSYSIISVFPLSVYACMFTQAQRLLPAVEPWSYHHNSLCLFQYMAWVAITMPTPQDDHVSLFLSIIFNPASCFDLSTEMSCRSCPYWHYCKSPNKYNKNILKQQCKSLL